MKIKEVEECYNMTGVNPMVLFEGDFSPEDLSKLNPKVYQYLIWWNRKKTNPELTYKEVLEEDKDIDYKELTEAISNFFLGDLLTKEPITI